jgi:hypothetical protein
MVIAMLAVIWGTIGVLALLGSAIYRLSLVTWQALASPLCWYHWLFVAVWVVFMAYSEGYRGFQGSFSPRTVARLVELWRRPTVLRSLLAPLFVMGYFETRRRKMIAIYILTTVIIGFVIIVRQLPQPWRGLVDAGVVIGLAWGIIAMIFFAMQALSGTLKASPELPER